MAKKKQQKNYNQKIKLLTFFLLLPVWLIYKIGENIKVSFNLIFIFCNFLLKLLSKITLQPFNLISKNLSSFSLPSPKNNLSQRESLKSPILQTNHSVNFNRAVNKRDYNRKKKIGVFSLALKITFNFFKRIFPAPLRIALTIVFITFIFFGYSFFLIFIAHNLPDPRNLATSNSPETTEFYDRNGKLLYRLYEGKNRTEIDLDELPKYLIDATIAIEDKNFYSHPGIDISGIMRAGKAYLTDNQVQGGSTITQQLIKNTMLTPERSLSRKTKEIILAFWTERIYSKDEILDMYFNEVPYGGPAWGIAAAAQTYFDKNPSELSLAESAYLAGLPASPTVLSPYGTNPDLGKVRQGQVLKRMVDDGYISQKEADEAYAQELAIKSPINQIQAPHFVMYIRAILAEKYGEKVVSQGGLKVTTTLDLDIQHEAETIVSEEVSKLTSLNASNAAAMVTDAKTGQILAMVGNKNYWEQKSGNYNVAVALRQPGSSIKPVTYATGFKVGYSPGTTLLDTPVVFKNAWETYAPVNYDGVFHGPVSIRTALGSSYNIPAVKMLALVGLPEMIQTSKDLGITTFNNPNRYGLSLTLGGGDVKLIDMMTVYGTFSQLGTRYDAEGVLKIVDSKDNVIEDNSNPQGKQVLSPGIAYMITNILSDNKARTPAFGPNSLLQIAGHTAAVKTGTTDNKRDNWTFGYTPEYVVGVWVGNMDNTPMNPQLTSGVTGAAPIWNRIMKSIVENRPDIAFTKPQGVTEALVDGKRDLILSGVAQKSVVGTGRRRAQGDDNKEGKDAITFTDPFSTYTPTEKKPTP